MRVQGPVQRRRVVKQQHPASSRALFCDPRTPPKKRGTFKQASIYSCKRFDCTRVHIVPFDHLSSGGSSFIALSIGIRVEWEIGNGNKQSKQTPGTEERPSRQRKTAHGAPWFFVLDVCLFVAGRRTKTLTRTLKSFFLLRGVSVETKGRASLNLR